MDDLPNACDYLILGGGSAGCTLAARLSEDPRVSIVLLEAGKDITQQTAPADVLSNYPGKAYFNPDFTWRGMTAMLGGAGANQPGERPRARYEQARILGGGSSINGLNANRGSPEDYDGWEQAGAVGWNWDSVLPYFRKLEHDLDFDNEYHGRDGPVAIRRFPISDWSGFAQGVAKVLHKRGYPLVEDQNGRWQDGVMPVTASVDEHGRRSSCAYAYLTPEVRGRKNLRVLTETTVERILFEGPRATGAQASANGRSMTIRAGEVILSCGTINSPAMLMRSGVGPAGELQRLEIPVVAASAGVGRNLIEHPVVSVSCYLTRPARLRNLHRHHTQAHLRFSSNVDDCPSGDMSLAIIVRSGWHAMGQRVGSLYVWVNKSYSQGAVTLRSPHVGDLPEIDFRMLSDGRDLTRLRNAFRFVSELAFDEELDGLRTHVFPTNYSDRVRKVSSPGIRNQFQMALFASILDALPGMRGYLIERVVTGGYRMSDLLADDVVLDAYLNRSVVGVWHPVGTCRMGAASDPMAVTDSSGRVRGVEGLRVCDASLMPTIPCANTNIPTIMVAERVADLIKAERVGSGSDTKAHAAAAAGASNG
jgi:5-(hydroxymethyl)furfural/furfural oxidase